MFVKKIIEPGDTKLMNTVCISFDEYASLLEDSRWRQCVEAQGVDCWEGFEDAMQEYEDSE